MSKSMDLSIKMKMLDEITAPIKKMRKSLDGTGTALDKLQANLKNTKAQEASLDAFKKTTQHASKNKAAINALNLTFKEKGKLTTAQATKLKKLNGLNSEYTKSLRSQSASLKKMGISTKNLKQSEKALQASREKSLKQIKKINKHTKKLVALRSKLKSVAKMGAIGGVAAIASVAKLGGVLRSTADEMDKMHKQAKNMQLPLDQFQALRHQAELAGVANDALTKSYQTFNKNLGELKTKKSSLMSTALKDFDPQLLELMKNAKDSVAAYDMVLVKMQGMTDASKKAALANAVFGRNGKDMLNMLSEGTDGLAKAKANLAALGGGLTAKDAKAAEDFNDSITRMGQAFDTVKFAAFTPMLKDLTSLFERLIGKMKDKAWRDDITAKLQSGLKTIMSLIKSTMKLFQSLAPVIKFVADNFTLVASVLVAVKLPAIIGTVTAAFNLLKVAMLTNPITATIAAVAAAAYLIYDNWEGISDFFKGIWGSVKSVFYSGIVFIVKSIKRITALIPDKFLPDSMSADSLDKTIAKYKALANTIKTNDIASKIKDTTNSIQSKIVVDNQPQPAQKSTVEVKVKIDSQTPATVEKVKTTGISSINLDIGNFATAGYN